MIRVAINGFGRIGRTFLRAAWTDRDVDIVAINDLGSLENLAYLLSYDSVYGRFAPPVSVDPSTNSEQGGVLTIGAKRVRFLQEADPAKLPWRELGIDVVVEATGVFDRF